MIFRMSSVKVGHVVSCEWCPSCTTDRRSSHVAQGIHFLPMQPATMLYPLVASCKAPYYMHCVHCKLNHQWRRHWENCVYKRSAAKVCCFRVLREGTNCVDVIWRDGRSLEERTLLGQQSLATFVPMSWPFSSVCLSVYLLLWAKFVRILTDLNKYIFPICLGWSQRSRVAQRVSISPLHPRRVQSPRHDCCWLPCCLLVPLYGPMSYNPLSCVPDGNLFDQLRL